MISRDYNLDETNRENSHNYELLPSAFETISDSNIESNEQYSRKDDYKSSEEKKYIFEDPKYNSSDKVELMS